ncbi:MAG TPA: polysaccharide deacetylase family protein [Clostridiaceae bacterium]|nr:polysaccharide deacetylase family protein [Clostridiaceae bacterium]
MQKRYLGLVLALALILAVTGCHVPSRSQVMRQKSGIENNSLHQNQLANSQLSMTEGEQLAITAPSQTSSSTVIETTTTETTTQTSATTTAPTTTPTQTTTSTAFVTHPTMSMPEIVSTYPSATADASGQQALHVGLPEQAVGTNVISLTFDDGPRPDTTGPLLDVLKAYDVKATFCMVGWRVQGNEALVKRIVDEGHLLCNHSWDHPDLTSLTDEEVIKQIADTDAVLYNATGFKSPIIRPPYGAYDDRVTTLVDKPVLMWNLDTRDWESRDVDAIIEKVNNEIKPGDCLLFHDIYDTTVESVRILIPTLKDKGYTFVRTDELLTADGTPLNKGQVYHQAPPLPEPISTTENGAP